MLELLCLRSGRVVSKETHLDNLFGGIDASEMKIIDAFRCKLRKQIGREIQDAALIETVWGRGYRVNAEAVACFYKPSLNQAVVLGPSQVLSTAHDPNTASFRPP